MPRYCKTEIWTARQGKLRPDDYVNALFVTEERGETTGLPPADRGVRKGAKAGDVVIQSRDGTMTTMPAAEFLAAYRPATKSAANYHRRMVDEHPSIAALVKGAALKKREAAKPPAAPAKPSKGKGGK